MELKTNEELIESLAKEKAELRKLLIVRGQICTKIINNKCDAGMNILARRELGIITEYCRMLEDLEEYNQRKEEAESRIKTNEELIESLEKEKAELQGKIDRLGPFIREQSVQTGDIPQNHLMLLWRQFYVMQEYADILSKRIEDAKARV